MPRPPSKAAPSRRASAIARALFAAWLAAPGCGSSDAVETEAPAAGTIPTVGESDFGKAYSEATCDAIAACCASASIAFDRERCLAVSLAEAQARVAARLPGVQYDPVSAGKCVALLSVAVTTCQLTDDARARLDQACNEPFQGPVASCQAACFPAGAVASQTSCGAP